MAEAYLRIYADVGASGVTRSVTDASLANNTLTVAGDCTRNFIELTPFSVAGGSNSGNYFADGATFDGTNTVIAIHATSPTSVGTDGSGGTITEAHKFVELEWFQCRPVPNNPARRTRDRLGLTHMVRPVSSTAKKRFFIRLIVEPFHADALAVTNNNVALPTFIFGESFDDDDELTIYHYETHVDNAGNAYTVKRYYKGHLDAGEDFALLGSLFTIGGGEIAIPLAFDIHEDGTFTTLGNSSGGQTARTRPTT